MGKANAGSEARVGDEPIAYGAAILASGHMVACTRDSVQGEACMRARRRRKSV